MTRALYSGRKLKILDNHQKKYMEDYAADTRQVLVHVKRNMFSLHMTTDNCGMNKVKIVKNQ